MKNPPDNARILIYDIETSPLITYTWGIWEENAIEVIEDWQILCFAYKWLGEKRTYVVAQPDFRGYKPGINNDRGVVGELHRLFSEADVLIAHNGDSFDQKKSNARFMQRGLPPPNPYRTIDTRKVARKYANFTSNKLGELGKYLNVGTKAETGGFATWKGCLAGDRRAWDKMKRYNKQDVVLLEEIYLKLRPWIDNHPAVNLMRGELDNCPKCGGGPLKSRGRYKYAKLTTSWRYQCDNCRGWSIGRKPMPVKEHVSYVN